MQKQDYAGLSRTFDAYFPSVKQLVEQTEQFHNKQLVQSENTSYGLSFPTINLDVARQVGTLEINLKDVECFLPRLYFKKMDDRTNPYFYVITTPDDGILYFGSSLEDAKPKSIVASVSALTGGLAPVLETKQMYIAYLGLLSAVKKYGYCKVYELKTGYENIKLIDVKGKQIPLRTKSEYLAPALSHQLMESLEAIPIINQFTAQFMDDSQKVRDEEIWSAVSTFKGMIKNGLVDKLEMRPQPTDNQEIIVEYYGDDIMFRFKNKVSLMTDEEYGIKKTTELEKFVPTSAKILCQTGDTVYDKYTSYIAHKIKEDGKVDEKTTRRLIKLQSEFTSFERSIIDLGGGDKHIEYGNIYLGDLKHAVTSYRLFNDGTDSRITVNIGKSPTLAEIRLIICGIKDLFDLDPETKVILAS